MSRERRALLIVAQALGGAWWVESWLVLRGSSEGAAGCNGLLQIDCEIRRHTIRPR